MPDHFCVHNAFRSPGRLTPETELGHAKADVYRFRYERVPPQPTIKPLFIDGSSAPEFDGVAFAFVCVDKGPSRAAIFELLLSKQIPFIDVGMGLKRQAGASPAWSGPPTTRRRTGHGCARWPLPSSRKHLPTSTAATSRSRN